MQDEQHPFHRFRFCPLCGSDGFEEHGANARHCRACGFTYYTNPRGATVAVIVNDQGELLVGRRAKEPARGTLDLVGGFLDLDETVEEGLCREILEESGLEVDLHQARYLFSQPNRYPYSGIMCRTIDLFFEVRVKGRPAIKGMDDIAGLQWMRLDELDTSQFGLASVQRGLEAYLKRVRKV